MHEIDYALQILKTIDKATKEGDGKRVLLVRVKLGLAKGISPEALRAAFDWVKVDTIAEAVELEIVAIPMRIRCTLCESTYMTRELMRECPSCGSLGGELLSGGDFSIMSMEFEAMEALAC
jgi:hydrogenase nickel incorporation protein HypA/HybF